MDRAVPPVGHLQRKHDNSDEEERDVERCNEHVHMASSKYLHTQVKFPQISTVFRDWGHFVL
jgi:hypothetical protein